MDEHIANNCEYTNILSRDALPAVQRTIDQNNHASRIKDNILNLYSMDRIGYTDFNLRSYRTDDYVPRLFFESSRAQNFNETWVVKLSISSVDHSPTNPTALLNRSISFQLIMKSRPNHPKEIHFMVVRAPGSDFQLNHMTYMHRFTADNLETPYFTLPLSSPAEVNRMIGSRNFYLRVYFFQHHQHEDREGGRDSRDQRSSQGGWN